MRLSTLSLATVALVASMVMTVVSSLFAIRRLWKVDPIMLFE